MLWSTSLLLILAAAAACAQTGTVQLDACNAGAADIDLILSQTGRVRTTHIAPADCATLAETKGAMAQSLFGFAFPDPQGKWGTARRLDLLPAAWGGFARISQDVTVAHNNAQVPVTFQLRLTPRVPTRHTTSSRSYQNALPLGASPAEISLAVNMDHSMPTADTYCDYIG